MKEITLQEAALAWAQGKRVDAMDPSAKPELWMMVSEIGKDSRASYTAAVFNDDAASYRFRIAPEPPAKRYRPWTPNEVPVGGLFRKKGFAGVSLILSNGASRESGVSYVGWDNQFAKVLYQDALSFYEHSIDGGKTWLPCGVEVEA